MSDENNQPNKKKIIYRPRTRTILLFLLSLLFGVIALALIVLLIQFIVTRTAISKEVLLALFATGTFAVAFLKYLGDNHSQPSDSWRRFGYVSTRLSKRRAELSVPFLGGRIELAMQGPGAPQPDEVGEASVISDNDRARLVSELEQKIKVAAAEEAFREDVLRQVETIKSDAANDARLIAINAQYTVGRARLDQAIGLLHRKANINMLIGVVLSALGIFFLGITVVPGLFNKIFSIPQDILPTSESLSNSTQFWIHYLPRLTLAVVLELFAYFFLNLYKANAAETRYYHNEITNLSARHSALMSASNPRDPDLLKLVIVDLLKTERNGILTKSQTTVEIARAKAEAESSKDVISMVTKLAESFGKRSGKAEEK